MGVRTADQIRQEFIQFFEGKAHTFVPSSPVVPADDPTLMFTNAGMNQFKDVFLATGSRPYTRAANTQKCIRAGGKHNDLDDVGHDTYHHTFFEMLGNWSFGDYFKREAISWAWELLTQVWGIDKKRLHATYFQGDPAEGLEPDSEAAELWRTITDMDPSHIHPGNKKDNFWEMGDTGPCGPCSEIHIDLTPDLSGGHLVNAGDPRVMEIWNLVFIQFNRAGDGKLSPLPARHIDTGMGFERITSVLQGKKSNYDTDVFAPIFAGIQKVTGAPDYTGLLEEPRASARADADTRTNSGARRAAEMKDIAYRVIADHIRCLTFALTDGAIPSNEGRGYVLRRILRRAVRYGRQYLNVHEPFLCKLVQVVVDAMGHAFPELKEKPQRVIDLIRDEEESFIKTLDRGIALFEDAADRSKAAGTNAISGEDAFKLHDTYGFPIDLTEVMARERSMTVDLAEYERLMEEARERARTGGKADVAFDLNISGDLPATNDSFKYASLQHESKVLGFVRNGAYQTSGDVQAAGGATLGLVLAETSAYGEQGGQSGDAGVIKTETGEFAVETTKRTRDCVLHLGTVVRGNIKTGQRAVIEVNPSRIPTMQNHTATHVLNWALREVLEFGGGGKVDQKGSLVDPDKTRFDFSHSKALTPEEVDRIESLCNEQIKADYEVFTREVAQADARKVNTLRAVFGEKYPDTVRVVSIGGEIDKLLANPANPDWMKLSVEFCGGTHVKRTSEIGAFVLTHEESAAKGIRRLVGITGDRANKAIARARDLLAQVQSIKSGPESQIAERLAELQKSMGEAEIPARDRHGLRAAIAELQQLAKQQSKQQAVESAGAVKGARQALLEKAERHNGIAIIAGELPEVPVVQIREAADWLRTQAGSAAVVLGAVIEGKPLLLAAMTEDLVKKGLKAGDLIKHIVPAIDGRGGGKPDLAQAGGNKPEGVSEALAAAVAWLKEKI